MHGYDAEFSLMIDGLVRHEGGASPSDLPEGSLEAMVSFADEFNDRYPALKDVEGTYPMGLSSLTVCTTREIAEEGGISAEEAEKALGMFMKAKDGSFNAGIYMNVDLLLSATLEEVVSDFRHEYGHYVGWFIERSGVGSVEGTVRAALEELAWDASDESREVTSALIIGDLSDYAGEGWTDNLPAEVFAEAFRVWQEGGDSRLAAILGPVIDAALRGVAEMLRMPEDIRLMLNEWAARQRESSAPVEKPKELQDYLEERRRIIEKAEANGCMIG